MRALTGRRNVVFYGRTVWSSLPFAALDSGLSLRMGERKLMIRGHSYSGQLKGSKFPRRGTGLMILAPSTNV